MKLEVIALQSVRPREVMRAPTELTLDVHMKEYHAQDFLCGLLEEFGVEWLIQEMKREGYKVTKEKKESKGGQR